MASLELPDSLVSVDWLQRHLGHDKLVVFDSSWHMPATGRDGYDEWRRQRIPGARFFDFDGSLADPDSKLPHMMSSAEVFTREMRALGLERDSRVVVYDSMGMFSSPRGWWMLRAMGCENSALLDGGLPAWNAAGYATDSLEREPGYAAGDVAASLDRDFVADSAAVLAALDDSSAAVVDARPEARFSGASEEPRPGLRRGHMPGAFNLPFADFFEDGLLKPKDELKAMLEPIIGGRQRSIYSCGSGVTACIIAFAAFYTGYRNLAVYDGSWCEWGLPGDLPVVTG